MERGMWAHRSMQKGGRGILMKYGALIRDEVMSFSLQWWINENIFEKRWGIAYPVRFSYRKTLISVDGQLLTKAWSTRLGRKVKVGQSDTPLIPWISIRSINSLFHSYFNWPLSDYWLSLSPTGISYKFTRRYILFIDGPRMGGLELSFIEHIWWKKLNNCLTGGFGLQVGWRSTNKDVNWKKNRSKGTNETHDYKNTFRDLIWNEVNGFSLWNSPDRSKSTYLISVRVVIEWVYRFDFKELKCGPEGYSAFSLNK